MKTFFGEMAAGPRGPALKIACYAEDHNTLILGLVLCTLYIDIPMWFHKGYDIEKGWGFAFYSDAVHFDWNEKTKVWRYPWTWEFYKRWELVDGPRYAKGETMWVEVPRSMPHGQIATKQVADYTYVRKNGEKQEATATYWVSRMEWRMRWAKWFPFVRKVRTSIDVVFDREIGEGVDSWKGGVIGCGQDMLPGESALECLRRMERDRKFNR